MVHGYQSVVTQARLTNVASIRMSFKVGYVPAKPAEAPEIS
jgi:hypothetical protein